MRWFGVRAVIRIREVITAVRVIPTVIIPVVVSAAIARAGDRPGR